jgi:hypothetical protein
MFTSKGAERLHRNPARTTVKELDMDCLGRKKQEAMPEGT